MPAVFVQSICSIFGSWSSFNCNHWFVLISAIGFKSRATLRLLIRLFGLKDLLYQSSKDVGSVAPHRRKTSFEYNPNVQSDGHARFCSAWFFIATSTSPHIWGRSCSVKQNLCLQRRCKIALWRKWTPLSDDPVKAYSNPFPSQLISSSHSISLQNTRLPKPICCDCYLQENLHYTH